MVLLRAVVIELVSELLIERVTNFVRLCFASRGIFLLRHAVSDLNSTHEYYHRAAVAIDDTKFMRSEVPVPDQSDLRTDQIRARTCASCFQITNRRKKLECMKICICSNHRSFWSVMV